MAIPKQITNNEEKDYATLYQDNFVKRNDPAMLGTQALNRQLSQGIQNNMNNNVEPNMNNNVEPNVTDDLACPAGYTRDSLGRCVLDTPYSAVQVDAIQTQDAVNAEKYRRMATGYGVSGDLSGATNAPSLPTETPTPTPTPTSNLNMSMVDDEVARLTQQFTDEERYLNEEFNRYYSDLVRQAEQRDARSGGSPFTGGIARQLEDYMSAAEIEALGNLQMERDRRVTELNQNKQNIRKQAVINVLEQRAAEMQTVQQQIEYSQQLAQYVVSGSLSLEEATQLSEELGLNNPQELLADAIKTQINAGVYTEEEAKAELEGLGIDPTIIDDEGAGGVVDTAAANTEAANQFNAELDSLLGSFVFGEGTGGTGTFSTILASAGAGAATGATIGLVGAAPGAALGAVIGGLVGLVGGIATAVGTQQINERDLPQLLNPILDTGIITADFYNGESEDITVTKSPTANNTSNFYDDAYVINVDGTDYTFEGADLLTLATVLQRAGKNNAEKYPEYQAIFTEAAKIYDRGVGAEITMESIFGLKRSNALNIYKKVFNK